MVKPIPMYIMNPFCYQTARDFMRKRFTRKSKRAITLVELVAAMALLAIFLLACTSLIFPVVNIYNHMNEMSRAHLLADTVVDSLRTECARTYISSKNDVWISNKSGDAVMDSFPGSTTVPSGVLVIRKNYEYCETLSANYGISAALCNSIYDAENTDEVDPLTGSLTSRAIYNMFDSVPTSGDEDNIVSPKGHLHYGFFKVGLEENNGVFPAELYDFTDPFMDPTYSDFTVDLLFHDIKYDSDDIPVYVLVDVQVFDGVKNIYTRSNVVLSFASSVLE